MNYGHFAGRIGRDAELRQTPSGQQVANFSLAVDTGWGENKQTLWIDCAVWGDRSAKLAPFLLKGKQVAISGDVGLRTFEKRDGGAGAAMTCNVQRLTLQGGANGDGRPADHQGPSAEQRADVERGAPAPARRPAPAPEAGDFDDSIPF